ncbi:MAG: putative ATP synthase YscN [candidate division BRC1 bacterium ADurb.BinA364]|nr:MAG: putative ATP synthase YscN [candidate division BRC1 bacterium ADurb.BinA364]
MKVDLDIEAMADFLRRTETIAVTGRVTQVIGTIIEGQVPDCSIGRLCDIVASPFDPPVKAEVVGFRQDKALMMPLGEMQGLKPGAHIRSAKSSPTIRVGDHLLGRVIDGLGEPLDGAPLLGGQIEYPLYAEPLNPFQRQRITQPLDLGVRAINGLLTCGIGQRIGIMSGSGVGKSTLLGMMARYTSADVTVIGLVGERGRELRDFLERDLGAEGMRRSVVVAATSDTSPLVRVRAAFLATAIAEFFRDTGANVLLMMDSVTRFAMAQRQVGLAIGEPPTTKGYTPSCFALLPKLLERAGQADEKRGSITGLYTVLVEGDDMNEPIADTVRSILDGHIVLSRELAQQRHYPAIDVLASVSRLMPDIASAEQQGFAARFVSLLSAYRKAETLINIGAYSKGSNAEIDMAIAMIGRLNNYLKQPIDQRCAYGESLDQLKALMSAPEAVRPAGRG